MNKSIVKTVAFLSANFTFIVGNGIAHDVPQSETKRTEIKENLDLEQTKRETKRLLNEFDKNSRELEKRVLKLESQETQLSKKVFHYEAAFCLTALATYLGMRWSARNRYMYVSMPPLTSWTRNLMQPRYIIPFGLTYAGYGLYRGQIANNTKK